jgi:hypothetical protein
MKKYILLFVVVFQFGYATEKDSLVHSNWVKKYYTVFEEEDCDACGCSASGGSMGFASMLNSNFVGIRYFNQQYKSKSGLYSDAPWYKENYSTTQVWARIPVVKKVQISLLIPYHAHKRTTEVEDQEISGLGDVTILAMYQLYQTHRDSTFFTHTLHVGGGIKAPTGVYDAANNTGNVNKSFQLGTGSWDFQLLSEYIVRRKKMGLNSMINYIWKSENNNYYRYGNQFNYSSTLFYLYEKNNLSLAPQLGIAGEVYGSNYHHKQYEKETSGDILFGKFGVEVGVKKWSLGVNGMLPINQNLATGNIEADYRWSVNLNFSL